MTDTKHATFRIAKLACLTEAAKYLNKLAELQGNDPMDEEEVVEMVARADEKLPDEVIETVDNRALKVMVVESLVRAAEEMASETPDRVTPQDTNLVNLGQGSILKEVVTNPNARSDGVDIMPEVNVIELNLLSTDTGDGEKEMNESTKIATLTETMLKLANEVASMKEDILSIQQGLNQDDTKATETKEIAQANPREEVSKLTKEDDIYDSKTSDEDVAALVAAPDKNDKGPAEIKSEADGPSKQSFANDKEKLAYIIKKYKNSKK